METSKESLRVHADTVESMGTEELSANYAYKMKQETNEIQILKNVTKIKIMRSLRESASTVEKLDIVNSNARKKRVTNPERKKTS